MVALLGIAALVVDLGGAYSWKRKIQNVADFAALAGARRLPGSPAAACSASWAYLKANLSDLPDGAGSPCGGFPSSCTPGGPSADYEATSESPYTITFRYPIPDGDWTLGSPRTEDGTNPCERIAVTVVRQSPVFFAPAVGVGAISPRATAVARHSSGFDLEKVANLVVLDPTGCVGLSVQGTGTQALVGTAEKPGSIAVDSDGTTCGGGNATTISTGGAGSHLFALPTSGGTPGEIRLLAQPGNLVTCAPVACNQVDVPANLAPQPLNLRTRVTRGVVDHTYNCKSSYPGYHGIAIAGCDESTGAYIDSLVSQVTAAGSAAPAGWTLVNGNKCNSNTDMTISGNAWVVCGGSGFRVNGVTVDFTGGNVVFYSGDVSINGGTLKFNSSNSASLPTACRTSVCLNASSAGAAFVYLVNGNLASQAGSASSVMFTNAMLYVTAGSGNYVASASGATQNWTAPTEGPFKNLALWSDSSSNKFQLTGGGASSVDGVFFTPEAAPFTIAGGFTNPQTAQFLSFHLAVNGGSLLQMTPDEDRLLHTAPSGSVLIR